MLERHLSKRKRQRVAIKKKNAARISLRRTSSELKKIFSVPAERNGKESGDLDQ
jgi:hypothetical protein